MRKLFTLCILVCLEVSIFAQNKTEKKFNTNNSETKQPTPVSNEKVTTAKQPTLVSNEKVSVAKQPTPVSNEKVSVVKQPTPVSNEKVSVVKQPTPVSNEKVSVVKQTTPVSNEKVSVAKQTTPVSNEKVSVAKQTTPVSNEKASVSKQPTPVSNEKVSVAKQTTPVSNEKVSVAKQTTPVSNEKVSVAKQPTPVSNEKVSVSKQPTPVSNEKVSVSKQTTPVSNEKASVAKQTTPVSNEKASVAKQPTPVSNEKVSVAKQTTPVSNEKVSAAKQTTPVSNEKVSATKPFSTVGMDSFGLKSSKETFYCKKMELKTPLLKDASLIADGKTYDFADVKFYSIGKNYYERFRDSKNDNWGNFLRREITGKINFYSQRKMEEVKDIKSGWEPNKSSMGSTYQTYTTTTYRNTETLYFQVGNEAPQVFSYSKLEDYVKTNEKSMNLLKKAKRNNALSTGLLISGGLIAGYGLYRTTQSVYSKDANGTIIETSRRISPLTIVGATVIGAKFVLKSPRKLGIEAIKAYNAD